MSGTVLTAFFGGMVGAATNDLIRWLRGRRRDRWVRERAEAMEAYRACEITADQLRETLDEIGEQR